jgi:hypothetical protein
MGWAGNFNNGISKKRADIEAERREIDRRWALNSCCAGAQSTGAVAFFQCYRPRPVNALLGFRDLAKIPTQEIMITQ